MTALGDATAAEVADDDAAPTTADDETMVDEVEDTLTLLEYEDEDELLPMTEGFAGIDPLVQTIEPTVTSLVDK